ncbi:hypothetical protein QFZ94_000771 [Paraburkholderia sp. JPY465]|uniref:hypothetical protein n=1 Tax=Paraburkholderia sp. JPY465 TaxID=3042285 RepID=UPI003D1FE26B
MWDSITPVPSAVDRVALLERMVALILLAGESYRAQFSELARLARTGADGLDPGPECAGLLAEIEKRAQVAGEVLRST